MATETTIVGNKNYRLYVNSDGSLNVKDVPLITYIDTASASVEYYGMATPSTSTSSPYWRILKKTVSGTVTSYLYADGDSNFDNVWDDRASLSYS